jgi:hypothetical protein
MRRTLSRHHRTCRFRLGVSTASRALVRACCIGLRGARSCSAAHREELRVKVRGWAIKGLAVRVWVFNTTNNGTGWLQEAYDPISAAGQAGSSAAVSQQQRCAQSLRQPTAPFSPDPVAALIEPLRNIG